MSDSTETDTDTDIRSGSEGGTTVGAAPNRLARMGRSTPFLTIAYPTANQQHFEIGAAPLVIGRGRNVGVVIDDRLASREHCRVSLTAEGIVVEDLESTNGTMIDGVTIQRARLGTESRLQIGDYIFRLEYRNREELAYERALVEAATTDPLTGIANRNALIERAGLLYGQCRREGRALAIAMLDIDHFKRINDMHGHPAGDHVIKLVAQMLADQMRESDIFGRYGGEEFMAVLPDLDGAGAETACERLRTAVESMEIAWSGTPLAVTISVGMCARAGNTLEGLDAGIATADKALYAAKHAGRNRVCTG